MELTPKERSVLEFVKDYKGAHGTSPTYREIMTHFGFSAASTVHQYLTQLAKKGAVESRGDNRKRHIRVLPAVATVPLLGVVRAGEPVESFEDREEVEVPPSLLAPKSDHYALRVRGDSMIDEGIRDGDLIVVRSANEARNGQNVVALVDGREVTLKKYYRKGDLVELRPANEAMSPIVLEASRLTIQGVMVGLFRQY